MAIQQFIVINQEHIRRWREEVRVCVGCALACGGARCVFVVLCARCVGVLVCSGCALCARVCGYVRACVCVGFTSAPRTSRCVVIVHALFLCLIVLVVNFWWPTVVVQLVAECLQLFYCLWTIVMSCFLPLVFVCGTITDRHWSEHKWP